MTRFATLAAAAALAFTTSLTAFAQDGTADAKKVVAKVGGVEITAAQVDEAISDMGQRMANVPKEQARQRALDALIDTYVIADLGRKAGLDQDPDFLARMKQQEARTLQALYFGRTIEPAVSDDAVKAAYDEQLKTLQPKQQVRARHILLKTEEEAVAVIEEIKGGADFEAVAKAKSTGPSGPKGGDLGFFGQGQMVPEFEAAAFALEPGSVTDKPVKTQFGFHVIKVEEKRAEPAPAFEQVAPQLRNNLLRTAYLEAVKKGRAEVGVEVTDQAYALPQQ